jgi:AmiR/NasT family two-component response regulator
MHRHGLNRADAFVELRADARRKRRRMMDLARGVISGEDIRINS